MRKALIALTLMLLLAVMLAVAGLQWWRAYLDRPLEYQTHEVEYLLPKGAGFIRVANDLQAQGVWQHGRLVAWYYRLFEPELVLKVGEYHFEPGLSPRQIVAKMANGEVLEYSVTLVEGSTLTQILQALQAAEQLESTLPADAVLSADTLSLTHDATLLPSLTSYEGLFFPDTYHYVRGDTDVSILRRAYQRLLDQLQHAWEQRDAKLPYKTPYDLLIMASLVERETGAPEERAEIAGVFVRRLQRGMRLQTDPTVIYGLGDAYKGNLTRRHLRQDTPYNTYTRHGLTPTPIAAAGKEALLAAAKPQSGDSLYFVAKGDGRHQFSATLKEHEKAVREYQILKRRADYRSSPIANEAK